MARREYWDTCLWIAYLKDLEAERASVERIDAMIRRAQNPNEGVLIIVSAFCLAEIRQRSEYDPYRWDIVQDSFYTDRPYIRVVGLSPAIAQLASSIGGQFNGLKPADASHLATAITEKAHVFYTLDGFHEHGVRRATDILDYDGQIGTPPLAIRPPEWPPNSQGRLLDAKG